MRPFLLANLVVALGVVAGQAGNVPWLYNAAKPFIMITLGVGYWVASPAAARSQMVIMAIVFSWLGDVLLMNAGELFFMGGLGAFLIAHICYIIAYRQHRNMQGEGLNGVQRMRFSFPVILFTTGLLTVLFPHLGGLTIPVIFYALAITIMMLQAIFRFGFTNDRSFWLVFAGALLFVISDSALAINKFMGGFNLAGLVVMVTYMSAQVLIVAGLQRHT